MRSMRMIPLLHLPQAKQSLLSLHSLWIKPIAWCLMVKCTNCLSCKSPTSYHFLLLTHPYQNCLILLWFVIFPNIPIVFFQHIYLFFSSAPDCFYFVFCPRLPSPAESLFFCSFSLLVCSRFDHVFDIFLLFSFVPNGCCWFLLPIGSPCRKPFLHFPLSWFFPDLNGFTDACPSIRSCFDIFSFFSFVLLLDISCCFLPPIVFPCRKPFLHFPFALDPVDKNLTDVNLHNVHSPIFFHAHPHPPPPSPSPNTW